MPRVRRSQKNRDNEIDSMSLLEVATQLKEEILGLQEQVKQLKEEIITLQQYRDQIQQGRGDQINMSPKEMPPVRGSSSEQYMETLAREPSEVWELPAEEPAYRAPKCSLPTFDGTGSLKKFLRHFGDACIINRWHLQREKGMWLKMCLEGRARDVLHDNTHEFLDICQRLHNSFGDHLKKRKYEIMLPTRKRKFNESLVDLATDIREMTNVVYGELDNHTREKMTIKHFIMALDSPQAQYELTQNNATSLDEILASAQIREMYFGQETGWQSNLKTESTKAPKTSPCRHCGGNHPSYVCQPCRHCGGGHYDNRCPTRAGNEEPVTVSPTVTGNTNRGQ